jgi:hypothetical protein
MKTQTNPLHTQQNIPHRPIKKYVGLSWQAWLFLLIVIGSIPLVNLVSLPVMFLALIIVGAVLAWRRWFH